jgi:hypothetical protein
MRRRVLRVALVLALVLVGVAAALFVRVKWFPPRFDVTSIAAAPEYRDPALLARAWDMPVARMYAHRVDFQTNGSVCGPTSLANVFRSLGDGPTTSDGVLEGTGKCWSGMCWMGLSLDDLASVTRTKTKRTVTVLRGLSLPEFRAHLARVNDPTRRYVANFQRGLLFGKGVGHHSPLAAYLADRDLVLVLDVNPSFGPWLVSAERLFRAMDRPDSSTGKKRGLLLIE